MITPLPPLFESDRWGNSWSKDGVLLRFGSASMATAVRLDVSSAADLATQLKTSVAQYEAIHGAVWSEDALAHGKVTETSLPIEKQHSLAPEGLSLYKLIKNLPLDGMEQSFKLRHGELLDNRFLAGISRSKLSDEDFQYLADTMGAPTAFLNAIRDQLEHSVFFHIGFEQGTQSSTYKLYLEFPLAKGTDREGGLPLYRGFKWKPQDPLQHAVSTYAQPVRMELHMLLTSMAGAFGGIDCAAFRAAREIIKLAAERAEAKTLNLVGVQESDSPRTSFDVNLYDTGLKVHELVPVLAILAKGLEITKKYQGVFEHSQSHLAGHISGGTDRQGQPFLTIYHAGQRSLAPLARL